jgi:hypothetical protein
VDFFASIGQPVDFYLQDTSELVDALSDGQLGDLSLEAISQRLLSGSGEDIVGFGNSGNNAVVSSSLL